MTKLNYLIVVLGPTAIGKTAYSIKLAQYFNTEIISADSRQFYREMQIGTASPTAQELSLVQHHFIGNKSVQEPYTVFDYQQEAVDFIAQLFTKYAVVVLTGGSGLYIDAVCNGLDEMPNIEERIRQEVRLEYQLHGLQYLQEQVQKLDPLYYKTVDIHNPKRLMRAIEVVRQTNKTYSSFRKQKPISRNFKVIKIGLNTEREYLYNRINVRVDNMMLLGLEDEVRGLSHLAHLNALNTVGYKELFQYFEKKIMFEQAVTLIKQNSRHYAKRQLTWFNKDLQIKWLDPFNLDGEVEKAIVFIEQQIGNIM